MQFVITCSSEGNGKNKLRHRNISPVSCSSCNPLPLYSLNTLQEVMKLILAIGFVHVVLFFVKCAKRFQHLIFNIIIISLDITSTLTSYQVVKTLQVVP